MPPSTQSQAALLRRSVSMLSRRLRPAPMPEDLSLAKLSVLSQLYRQGSLSATDLAQREGVRLQSLTRLLAELQASGWVVRKPHPVDGRQSLLSLTRIGVKRLGEVMQPGEAVLAQALQAALSEAERALLLRACELMDRLEQVLTEASHAAASQEQLA